MSKMNDLSLILDEMIASGQKMIEAANELKKIYSSEGSTEEVETPTPELEEKTYTFQEVRGIMATLMSKGKKAEAKSLLTMFNATRLSDVKESDYPALVAEAEVLLNG